MPFTIYALIDPRTDEVRYIGCTMQPLEQRAKAHLTDRGNARKYQWVQELRQANLEPKVQLLEEAEDEPAEREQHWIALKQAEGCELFNGWQSSQRYWTRPKTSISTESTESIPKILVHPEAVPPFADDAEEAEWWATHDIAGDWKPGRLDERLPPPEVFRRAREQRTGPQRAQPVLVRLDADILDRLRALAERKGTGYQTLLKRFVTERLYEEEKLEGMFGKPAGEALQ